MNVPDEAVEAARSAYLAYPKKRDMSNSADAWRAALEAAAPFMICDPHAGFLAWFRSVGKESS